MATFTSICIPSAQHDAKDSQEEECEEEEEEEEEGGYGSVDSPLSRYSLSLSLSLSQLQSPSAFPSYLSSAEDDFEHSQIDSFTLDCVSHDDLHALSPLRFLRGTQEDSWTETPHHSSDEWEALSVKGDSSLGEDINDKAMNSNANHGCTVENLTAEEVSCKETITLHHIFRENPEEEKVFCEETPILSNECAEKAKKEQSVTCEQTLTPYPEQFICRETRDSSRHGNKNVCSRASPPNSAKQRHPLLVATCNGATVIPSGKSNPCRSKEKSSLHPIPAPSCEIHVSSTPTTTAEEIPSLTATPAQGKENTNEIRRYDECRIEGGRSESSWSPAAAAAAAAGEEEDVVGKSVRGREDEGWICPREKKKMKIRRSIFRHMSGQGLLDSWIAKAKLS